MADEIDCANDIAQAERDRAVAAASKVEPLPYTGRCYNCGELHDWPARFCDADCRDDYELRVKRGAV